MISDLRRIRIVISCWIVLSVTLQIGRNGLRVLTAFQWGLLSFKAYELHLAMQSRFMDVQVLI